ncbi:hypothetical protein FDP41_009931 [Naegleria fowleri]|uniref:Uncharacterized protein n=1 Tax=Naegleria fowleri TaxID=5763 RepID=A0A6A5BCI0_NAEFO|nr:uncharacterized protein FDP41_009931 [Naegleria fowleri]KAF0971708.1 hypothetical protein FDP41_009931 [Naegleria fowleri]
MVAAASTMNPPSLPISSSSSLPLHQIIPNNGSMMSTPTQSTSNLNHHHQYPTTTSRGNNTNPYAVGSGLNFQQQTPSLHHSHHTTATAPSSNHNNMFQFSSGVVGAPSVMSFQTNATNSYLPSHASTTSTSGPTSRLAKESGSSQDDDLFSVDRFFRHANVDRTMTTPIPTTNATTSSFQPILNSSRPTISTVSGNNAFSPPQWSHNYVTSSQGQGGHSMIKTISPRPSQTSDMMNNGLVVNAMMDQRINSVGNSQVPTVENINGVMNATHHTRQQPNASNNQATITTEEISQSTATTKKSKKKKSNQKTTTSETQQASQDVENNNSAKQKKLVTKTDSKPASSVSNQGSIKVTRNISAERVENPTEPVEFPLDGVLYAYNVADWADKNSFYDKIAYSFGTPSTQKKVHCAYLNCKVMHYERTCQGVYYCPHATDDEEHCIVRPCRLRFHTCQKHNNTSLTKSGKCPFKLHFYVPLEKDDNRRLLLCIGTHNHPLLGDTTTMNSGITVPLEKKSKLSNAASSSNLLMTSSPAQEGSSQLSSSQPQPQRKASESKKTCKDKSQPTPQPNTATVTTHSPSQNYSQPSQNFSSQGISQYSMPPQSGYSSTINNNGQQQQSYHASSSSMKNERISPSFGGINIADSHVNSSASMGSNVVASMSPPPSLKTFTRSTSHPMTNLNPTTNATTNMFSGGGSQALHGSSNTYSGSSKTMTSSSSPPLHDLELEMNSPNYALLSNPSSNNMASQLLGASSSQKASSGGGGSASSQKIHSASTLLQPSDYLQHVAKPPSYSTNNYSTNDITRNPHTTTVQSSPTSFMSASSPSLYRFSPNYPLRPASNSPHHHYSPHPPRINSSPLSSSFTSPSPLSQQSGLYHPSPTSQFPPLPTQNSPSLFYENSYGGIRNPSPHAIVYRGSDEMDGLNARKRERLDGSFDAQKKVKADLDDETPNLPPIMMDPKLF